MAMINAKDFVSKAYAIEEQKTLYVMGGIGQKLTEANKQRFISGYEYNLRPERRKQSINASNEVHAFDCSGLIKSIIWGFPTVSYSSNGLPDYNANQLKNSYNKNVVWSMEGIVPGAILWMQGHVGIYAGDGRVIECSPKWEDGVQLTKITSRKWMCWFKMDDVIDYSNSFADARLYVDIKKGDTLSKLAKTYKTTIKHLMEINPQIEDKNKIFAGDKIRVR